MVSAKTRRKCGSSAMYSSHANAGTKSMSAGPLLRTCRSPVASVLLDCAGGEDEQAQPHGAAAIAAAQTQVAHRQQPGDHEDQRRHERANQEADALARRVARHDVFVARPGPGRDDLEVHGPAPCRGRFDPDRHIRAIRIRALPTPPAPPRRSVGSTAAVTGENCASGSPASANSGVPVWRRRLECRVGVTATDRSGAGPPGG